MLKRRRVVLKDMLYFFFKKPWWNTRTAELITQSQKKFSIGRSGLAVVGNISDEWPSILPCTTIIVHGVVAAFYKNFGAKEANSHRNMVLRVSRKFCLIMEIVVSKVGTQDKKLQ